ncbi:hypothetical protein POM88_036205 [Heracleum sosnowskyi]|uniref:NAC domain-containing protein n=1 Tax=Heracleum sosnowskyi TaxID=360622 RepID=A0AAD8MFE4_9APIA|nr:hypothetical protein POM88_036205 [Heracleum sosnowskyi]
MAREDCRICCVCLTVPGLCFNPSDEQLIAFYLKHKIEGMPLQCNHLITELQIYHDDLMPWEIIKDDNPYWVTSSSDSSNKNKIKKTIYVFTELRKKKSGHVNMMRRSGGGSWKGQNNFIVKNNAGVDIGYNKLLTFYKDSDGKKGKKKKILDDVQEQGHWIMHEYSLFGIDNYVLCKIIKEVSFSEKASVLCPTKAVAVQDFCTQGDGHIVNVDSVDQERQSGDGDQTSDECEMSGLMEELYQELGMNISDVQELPRHSQPTTFDGQEDNQIPNFLVEEEAFAVVNQPLDDSHDTSAGVGVMDNHQEGQVIQDISLEETYEGLQDMPVAVWGKNGQGDGLYKVLDGHIVNVDSDDQERQSGDGDQTSDESTTDCEMSGLMEQLYQQLGMNISDVQELPKHSQTTTFDGQEDNNMIWDNQIPNFLVEEEAFAVVNKPLDDSHDTSAGVGVVKEVPVFGFGVMDNHQEGQVIQDISLEETDAGLQDMPVAVWGKNGQGDGLYKVLDGAGNHDIIILDDDSSGVHDGQQSMMTEAADAPQVQALNVDNDMEGYFDDFYVYKDMEGYYDEFWNGLEGDLDFSSPDLLDLWPDEFNEQSCSIIEGQPGKRMRYGVADCEECPSGKKQRCL